MTATAGIDTWGVCWYVRSNSVAAQAMKGLATVPAARGKLIPEAVLEHRVGWFPEHCMIFAEGHPRPDRLASPTELPEVLEDLTAAMNDRGILPPAHRIAPMIDGAGNRLPVVGGTGFGGVRRLDATVDLQRDAAVGTAILRGVAVVEPPGSLRSNVHRSKRGRRIETITWEGARGKVARVYDKGIESGSHRLAGERVRFEDQRRYRKEVRYPVEAIAEGIAESSFKQRFAPLRQATKGIIVTSQAGMAERMQELVDDGELTPAEAAKLSGLIFLDAHGVELGSRTTRWRNRKAIARAGLLLSDGVVGDCEIDLGAEVEEALEVPWERCEA